MRSKNVLVITDWSYRDALIQTYTLPYVRMIRENIPSANRIYLVTLEQADVEVNLKDKKRIKNELKHEGIIWIDFRFSKFGFKAIFERVIQLVELLYLCFRKRIDYIHAWCSPAGVTGYLLSALTGKTLVLDGFEPHAVPSVELGVWKPDSTPFKLLFYFEKKQTKQAKVVITTSTYTAGLAKKMWGVSFKKEFVKPALIDLVNFKYEYKKDPYLLKLYGLENKIVCVYAGKVGGIYLEEEIFDFMKICHNYWGDKFRFFMITNTKRELVEQLCYQANLDKEVVISKYVEHKDVHKHIGLGDFAINPVKMVPSKKTCTSIKDGEYWAMGLPVVITNSLSEDVRIISENDAGAILGNLSEFEYEKAVEKIDYILKNYSIKELYEKIRPLAEINRNYNIGRKIYKAIYSGSALSKE